MTMWCFSVCSLLNLGFDGEQKQNGLHHRCVHYSRHMSVFAKGTLVQNQPGTSSTSSFLEITKHIYKTQFLQVI